MRRRTLYGVSKTVPCDVCLYDKTSDKLIIVEADEYRSSKYPSSKYSPVGVVVVPGSHNVYGDGSCAVMSLKEMNYNTPDTGSTTYQYIYWGQYLNDISNMTNYDQVCYVGRYGTVNQTVQGAVVDGYLPSDKFTKVKNPYDKDTYFHNNRTSDYYIPSPYNDDDTRNPAYYQTASPSSTANAFSDFDGVSNTTKIINLATTQSDWKTATTITNESGSGYSPVACCCWRYHTEGTKQGDWYLPACGELGYIMPKLKKIQQTIETLISVYGSSVGVQVRDGNSYWSSTEYGSKYVRSVGTSNGYVNYNNKEGINYVRAFLRVGA